MSNRIFDRDYVARISTGKAASESYRQERRARAWRAIGYVVLAVVVIGTGLLLERASAAPETPTTVDAPPGPVCPFGDDVRRTCF